MTDIGSWVFALLWEVRLSESSYAFELGIKKNGYDFGMRQLNMHFNKQS